jgi:hypothetical protein
MNRAKFTVRLPRDDLAVITAAAKKLGMTLNEYVRACALADARDSELETRIQVTLDARLAANSERLAADVQAARAEIVEQLAGLDGRLKGAFTQLHKTIVGAQQS